MRLDTGQVDHRTREARAFEAILMALASYAGAIWRRSLHLRVLGREVAMGAVVTALVDAHVLASGAVRHDGSLMPVLHHRLSWGNALRRDVVAFEALVRGVRPDAETLDMDRQTCAEATMPRVH
jgi:hypothetical protein